MRAGCILALLAVLTWNPPVTGNPGERFPHVVIILVDDMGYGDPGCFNPRSKIPTPNIDSLARMGMRFTDAHAPGAVCHPSRYGLLTGCYPFRTDVSVWPRQRVIGAGQVTVASLLQSRGYRTAMIGKWHLGFDENGYEQSLPGGPVDQGFDTFFGIRASTDIPPYFYIQGDRAVTAPTQPIEASQTEGWSPIQGAFWRAGLIAPDLMLADVLPRLTQEAVGLIEEHGQAGHAGPLMLYLAYPAPHTPWLPAREFVGRSGAGLYGDFVMMVDAMIGRVLAALDQADMSRSTLLVFASDNGPTWYDADAERFGHDSAGGLRGMKGDAWEAGHRVPLIVRWPGQVQAGSSSRQTICFTDILATLAELIDAPLPAGQATDSFSFLKVLRGQQPENEPVRGALVIPSSRGLLTIRSGPWKLITGLGSGGFSPPARVTPEPGGPRGQLYHLADDPGETSNLYQQQPEVVRRLEKELAEIRRAPQRQP